MAASICPCNRQGGDVRWDTQDIMTPETAARNRAIEYGDFQTPPELCSEVCHLLKASGVKPKSIVEPTCGRGSFVLAALEIFKTADIIGVDINAEYLTYLKGKIVP